MNRAVKIHTRSRTRQSVQRARSKASLCQRVLSVFLLSVFLAVRECPGAGLPTAVVGL